MSSPLLHCHKYPPSPPLNVVLSTHVYNERQVAANVGLNFSPLGVYSIIAGHKMGAVPRVSFTSKGNHTIVFCLNKVLMTFYLFLCWFHLIKVFTRKAFFKQWKYFVENRAQEKNLANRGPNLRFVFKASFKVLIPKSRGSWIMITLNCVHTKYNI